jgi:1-acyl-sn-glycerol-3-phosphate acyltransferase
MGAIRAPIRVILVLWTSFEAALEFAWLRTRGAVSPQRRAEWLQRVCARALRRVGVAVRHEGEPPREGLIVANHLSYADILALSSIMPCAFIAKKEVRSWPIFGWIAAQAGTLFVDRERKLETARFNESIDGLLRSGLRVVLFPEGTSSDGSTVLPFRPSLFEPAIASGVAITPAWIGYEATSGSVANDICYWGDMTLVPHLFRMFAIRAITAHIHFGTSVGGLNDRKLAAETTRDQVLRLGSLAATEERPSRMGA